MSGAPLLSSASSVESSVLRKNAEPAADVGEETVAWLPGQATGGIRSLVLIWGAAFALSMLLSQADPRLALVAVLAGSVAALSIPGQRPYARLLTVMALAPAAIPGLTVGPWMGAAALIACVGVVGPQPLRQSQSVQLSEPRRHLMRCRRRGDPAAVVVVALPGGRAHALKVARSFRLTDSVEVTRRGRRYEVHCVLDVGDLDRDGVERRVSADIAGGASFGWANFPDDGLTLDYLVGGARGELDDDDPAAARRGRHRGGAPFALAQQGHPAATATQQLMEVR